MSKTDIQEVVSRIANKHPAATDESLSAHEEKKWKMLGFCPEVSKQSPDCARFLLNSGLAFQIATLHNSETASRLGMVEYSEEEGPSIMMDGEWTPWSKLKELIDYDPVQECLIAKGQPAIGYNYIHPKGLVQKHASKFDELYPTCEI